MKKRNRRPQDSFGRRARSEGYAARSVYKLQEIDRRVRLLRRGLRVLELGASPGSWTRYASERVGPEGKVVAVDLQPLTISLAPNTEFLQCDVTKLDAADLGQAPAAFDLILSDMAPRTSGQRHRDQYLSYELYMQALAIARERLVPGGNFVGKLFQGAELELARSATAEAFAKLRIIKPEASRKESYELFLVGLGARSAMASS